VRNRPRIRVPQRLAPFLCIPALLGLATPTASSLLPDAPSADIVPAPSGDVATALAYLAPHAPRTSAREALSIAFGAYFEYRAANPDAVRKPYLYFVDLGLDNLTPRGWVFDMDLLEVVDGPFHVSHGRGSAAVRDGVPTRFSNVSGSFASSLGLYLAEETYAFRGTSGGRAYQSVGLRLRGESGPFNDAARMRGIVAHGAPYVTATGAGRSEGCPAMEPERAERLLPMIANGGVVFIYSPNDDQWLREGPWVRAAQQQ